MAELTERNVTMGARVLKSGLAVTIAATICHYFDIPVLFAAMAAVINIKPSVVQSRRNALEQVGVHIIGVSLAFAIGLTLGDNPLTMGLTTVLVISLCSRLGWTSGTLMGVVAALFILSASPKDFVSHAVDRTSAIFIGLAVGMTVNYFVLPPRYGQKLRAAMRDLGEEATAFFTGMVDCFITLKPISPQELDDKKKFFQGRINECVDLLARYREQVGRVRPRRTKPRNDPNYLEEYLRYQKGLYEKTLNLAEVINLRIERRKRAGDKPLSEEFHQVLAQLKQGAGTVVKLNRQLQQTVFDEARVVPEPVAYQYWEEMARVLESWRGKYSGGFYLHVLVDVGSIIGDLKWAAAKARELLFLAANQKNG
ncbi:MAG TPA: aromatic acid exporter family protein [Desulfobacteria bacterium]|nr:aromatic acid exporter family protein [Desulfobacteria bacterium]